MPVYLDVKVFPSAGKSLIKLTYNGIINCYLKSPAENNKANQELVKLFASCLSLTMQQVTITLGATSRKKRIRIETEMNKNQVYTVLGFDHQSTVFETK